MECPACGEELNSILAEHCYSIELIDGSWYRTDGEMCYRCGSCSDPLVVSEIADILKEVDELQWTD